MNDQAIMENILLTTKGVCDLYVHGAIESATQNVHCAFSDAPQRQPAHAGRGPTRKMAAKGWYPSEQVEQQKLDQVRQKFAGQN